MASSSNNATTGAPEFDDADAPDVAVNPTEVAAFAASVGTRPMGTTAEMNAYAYAREGLLWGNTTDGRDYRHDGVGWVREQVIAHGTVACPGTGDTLGDIGWSDVIDVTFPVGLFTVAPRVIPTTVGPADQICISGVAQNITTSGCKVRGIRVGSIPSNLFSVDWVAIQD